MIVNLKKLLVLGLLGLLLGCSTSLKDIEYSIAQSNTEHEWAHMEPYRVHGYLYDFRTYKTPIKVSDIQMIQLGDSHTAADLMTQAAREVLQKAYGVGAIGWGYPGRVPYHMNRKLTYTQSHWRIKDSRTDKDKKGFPLGGWIGQPTRSKGWLKIDLTQPELKQQSHRVRLYVRSRQSRQSIQWRDAKGRQGRIKTYSQWKWVSLNTHFPLTLKAKVAYQFDLGGVWVDTPKKGLSYSQIGVVGSKGSLWDRWQKNAMHTLQALKPHLVILSYGTNESFSLNLSEKAYRSALEHQIYRIREAVPEALILLIGAPDVYSKGRQGDSCVSKRPSSLRVVQSVQRDVAKTQGLLYWDWEQAMGGVCQFEKWQSRGLAQSDGVHFTAKGYRTFGEQLGQSLKVFLNGMSK